MKTVVGACDICKRPFEAKDKIVLARAIGSHKHSAHGVRGLTSRERYYVYKKGMTIDQARAHCAQTDGGIPRPSTPTERRTAYQKEYRRTHPKHKQQNGSNAIPALLDRCCVCGARFYVVKGT